MSVCNSYCYNNHPAIQIHYPGRECHPALPETIDWLRMHCSLLLPKDSPTEKRKMFVALSIHPTSMSGDLVEAKELQKFGLSFQEDQSKASLRKKWIFCSRGKQQPHWVSFENKTALLISLDSKDGRLGRFALKSEMLTRVVHGLIIGKELPFIREVLDAYETNKEQELDKTKALDFLKKRNETNERCPYNLDLTYAVKVSGQLLELYHEFQALLHQFDQGSVLLPDPGATRIFGAVQKKFVLGLTVEQIKNEKEAIEAEFDAVKKQPDDKERQNLKDRIISLLSRLFALDSGLLNLRASYLSFIEETIERGNEIEVLRCSLRELLQQVDSRKKARTV